MRRLLVIICLGAMLWSGYWLISSRAVKAGFESWLEARRAEGWAAEAADISVRGFPNRIDTVFTGLMLADPETGLAWEAGHFEVLALSYRPNHLIAVWPEEQRIATPLAKFDVASGDMRASLKVDAATALPLDRATLSAEALEIRAVDVPLGAEAGHTKIAELVLAVERLEGETQSYRFGLRADGVAPSLPWRVKIDPRGGLPDRLRALNADITVAFDAPWDRFAIEQARPQPRAIRVKLAEAKWGQLELALAGNLTVDEAGRPSGQLTVKAKNWRDILALGVEAGLVPDGLGRTIEDGLGLLSGLSGSRETLDVPLDFAEGRVYLGPIPLGPAPVLRLR